MKVLNVYYENQIVGRLTRNDDLIFGFTYDESWLKNPDGFPLSLAMPKQSEPFGNRITLSFFENLLPEGEVKESLQRSHGVTGVFDFLSNYGKDCAGAIVVTQQPNYEYSIDPNKVHEIDMEKVYTAIEQNNSVADVVADMNPGYLSLAGAQDKFPAIYRDNKFYVPIQGAPTTHIVKAPIQHSGIKESVYNEYFCMELAREVGFKIPTCFVIDGAHPLFVIERYDRYRDPKGIVHRLHQQDFCQAQGKTSEFKYEDKGGPTLKDNYQLILNHVAPRIRTQNIQLYLDWISFNLLVGNHDSHSKNISFLFNNLKIELAPFYDLICTAIYPRLKQQFSFKIGDRNKFSEISGNQIKLMEKSLEMKEGNFSASLKKINDKMLYVKDQVAKRICEKYPDAKIPKRISAMIEDRSKGLVHQGAFK